MAADSSWQLIIATMRSTASSFRRDTDDMLDRYKEDSSGAVVNSSRSAQMRMVMIAVGGFSMLEGILEQTRGWTKPFQDLDQELRGRNQTTVADEFMIYRLAINVLKHGYGDSYERLIRQVDLPFRLKGRDEVFFDEGDISEIPGLILVDDDFVQSCTLTVESALTTLEIPRLDL